MIVTRILVYFVIGTMKSGIDVTLHERLLILKQSTERKCRRVCRADSLRKYGGITMFKNKVKKVVAVALVAVLWVSGSSSAWAASTSGQGVTTGGNAGTTTIYYTFDCKSHYTSSIDACVISMNAASGNLVEFAYAPMKTTMKNGEVVETTTSITRSEYDINNKTWTVATGYAGRQYSSYVSYLEGGSIGVFGYVKIYNVSALY